MTAVAPPVIRWHLTKTETLPFHFGFHEKKPLSFEHATIHRKSITRLEQHFYLLRQQGDAIIFNRQAVQDIQPPVKPSVEQKYEKEDKLADELTAGGGQGAVEDTGMYEKELVDQAQTEAAHETLIASNKTFGAENATYDTVEEPITVAAVDEHIMSQLTAQSDSAAANAKYDPNAKYEGEPSGVTPDFDNASSTATTKSALDSEPAFPPPKDDILNLPDKDETVDLSHAELMVTSAGVPVVIPVAEPLEPTVIETVKQAEHPEVVDQEEQEEAERAAAQGALASGSLGPIEETLLTSALKSNEVPEVETGIVQMPVAEPVGTVTTTLHAPHPSLDESQLETLGSETLASEAATTETPTLTLDELRVQHEAEAAAAKAETERLESSDISPDEREMAEIALMSRTKRLAALHERIIRHQTLDAQGPDITAIKQSPSLPPTTASSKIMEIQQLHLAQQAESGVTHTAVEKSAPAPAGGSRIRELARLHEQKIKEEADAKKQQDDLFSGKAKVGASTPTGGKSRRNNKKR